MSPLICVQFFLSFLADPDETISMVDILDSGLKGLGHGARSTEIGEGVG